MQESRTGSPRNRAWTDPRRRACGSALDWQSAAEQSAAEQSAAKSPRRNSPRRRSPRRKSSGRVRGGSSPRRNSPRRTALTRSGNRRPDAVPRPMIATVRQQPAAGDLPEHVAANREAWDRYATEYEAPGRRAWARDQPTWGIWGVPKSELRLLPDDLDGRDAIDSAVGRPTSRPGSPAAGPARSGSTTRRSSSSRPAIPAGVRPGFPASPRQRRGDAVPGQQLRSRDQRVRRLPVGRPAPLGSGGGPHPAARRSAASLRTG